MDNKDKNKVYPDSWTGRCVDEKAFEEFWKKFWDDAVAAWPMSEEVLFEFQNKLGDFMVKMYPDHVERYGEEEYRNSCIRNLKATIEREIAEQKQFELEKQKELPRLEWDTTYDAIVDFKDKIIASWPIPSETLEMLADEYVKIDMPIVHPDASEDIDKALYDELAQARRLHFFNYVRAAGEKKLKARGHAVSPLTLQ